MSSDDGSLNEHSFDYRKQALEFDIENFKQKMDSQQVPKKKELMKHNRKNEKLTDEFGVESIAKVKRSKSFTKGSLSFIHFVDPCEKGEYEAFYKSLFYLEI